MPSEEVQEMGPDSSARLAAEGLHSSQRTRLDLLGHEKADCPHAWFYKESSQEESRARWSPWEEGTVPGSIFLPDASGSTWKPPMSHARQEKESPSQRDPSSAHKTSSPHAGLQCLLPSSGIPAVLLGETQPTLVGLAYIQLQHFLHSSITALGTTTFKPKWGT